MKKSAFFLFLILFTVLSSCSKINTENLDYNQIKCKANLKMISVAKNQVAVEYNLPDGEEILQEHISNILGAQFSTLECPSGGSYSINLSGKNPTCSVHGDLLPLVGRNIFGP